MIEASAFKDAEAYIRQQERTLAQLPPDQLGSFVLPSIEKLAIEHVEPITHAVSQDAIPETEVSWLGSALINGGNPEMINPQLEGVLPAGSSTLYPGYRFHGLLLPMDGSFLKIQTIASGQDAKNRISMQIVSFSFASEVEVEEFTVARARIGDTVEPGTTLVIPRKRVDYDRQYDEGSKVFLCVYDDYDSRNKSQALYSHVPANEQTQPERLTILHQEFMHGARLALVGLRSVLG